MTTVSIASKKLRQANIPLSTCFQVSSNLTLSRDVGALEDYFLLLVKVKMVDSRGLVLKLSPPCLCTDQLESALNSLADYTIECVLGRCFINSLSFISLSRDFFSEP